MAIEKVLKRLARLLYGWNYAVSLRLYRLPFSPDAGAEHYVAYALGCDRGAYSSRGLHRLQF